MRPPIFFMWLMFTGLQSTNAYTTEKTSIERSSSKSIIIKNIVAVGHASAVVDLLFASDTAIVGKWENEGQVMVFKSDNTVDIDGDTFSYKVIEDKLTLKLPGGDIELLYQVLGDRLTLAGPGGSVTYRKFDGDASDVHSANGQGVFAKEMTGKWCYMSAATDDGAAGSKECFVLNEDGSYEYEDPDQSSVTTSQLRGQSTSTSASFTPKTESGSWTLNDDVLEITSLSGKTRTFRLKKITDPVTGQSVIILDNKNAASNR